MSAAAPPDDPAPPNRRFAWRGWASVSQILVNGGLLAGLAALFAAMGTALAIAG